MCTLWSNERMVMDLCACWCWLPHTVPSKCSFMNHSCSVCWSQRYDFCVSILNCVAFRYSLFDKWSDNKKKSKRKSQPAAADSISMFNVNLGELRVASFNFPLVKVKCFCLSIDQKNQDSETIDYDKSDFNIGSWLIVFVIRHLFFNEYSAISRYLIRYLNFDKWHNDDIFGDKSISFQ